MAGPGAPDHPDDSYHCQKQDCQGNHLRLLKAPHHYRFLADEGQAEATERIPRYIQEKQQSFWKRPPASSLIMRRAVNQSGVRKLPTPAGGFFTWETAPDKRS